MLDIGFSELLVIGGVALVVLGPEKLAVVARSAGKWTGKAQRYVNDVKADIAREGELFELRKLKEEMETTGREIGSTLRTTASDMQQNLSAIEATVKADVDVGTGLSADSAAAVLSDQQAQASIQANLDGVGTPYSLPTINMTGKYQASLDATLSAPALSAPALNDPIALRMEYEALQGDVRRLENRMTQLKQDITAGLGSKPLSSPAASHV
jgi:sec-independent protein translocase protein TatB